MTVYELMQLLRKHPPDLRVVVDGYEDGLRRSVRRSSSASCA